ncbi:ABC transporter ATP-binding protein [Streptomyces thermospinosisporus]|uniref:ABC transporter ATP-binding protein n=1 Tax=Streptomyces thermospinosisporus TaxID=161482 RepID=A0ABP4JBQ5_9ACTN
MPHITDIRLPVVQLVRVCVEHHAAAAGRPALVEASVGFPERSLTAVVGPPGAGKTALLRCAAGRERPSRGRVFKGSRELAALDERELTQLRRLYVPRRPALPPAHTVYEHVTQAASVTGRVPSEAAVMEALRLVGLEEQAASRLTDLSAEQHKRVAIAAALPVGPRVMFVDEPSDGLDDAGVQRVMDAMRALVERAGYSVVIATRAPAVAAWADRAVLIGGGRVVGKIDWPTSDEIAAELADQPDVC